MKTANLIVVVAVCLILLILLVNIAPASAATVYQEIQVTDGASIKGKVLFKGEVPAPRKFLVTKNRDVCGDERERQEIVVTGEGHLQQVVVYLDKVAKGKPWGDTPKSYTLEQKNCEFGPYLQRIKRKSDLEVVNSDPVMHNIHTYELIGRARRTLFNVGQPGKGDSFHKVILTRRGNIVKVQCDAHDFMLGWIFVTTNPYNAMVDDKGAFEIRDIPPGSYKLTAWHPFLGTLTRTLNLSPKGEEVVTFEFK